MKSDERDREPAGLEVLNQLAVSNPDGKELSNHEEERQDEQGDSRNALFKVQSNQGEDNRCDVRNDSMKPGKETCDFPLPM